MKTLALTYRILLLGILMLLPLSAAAQARLIVNRADVHTEKPKKSSRKARKHKAAEALRDEVPDTLESPADTLTTDSVISIAALDSAYADTTAIGALADATIKDKTLKAQFVPNPKRALWLALVFPGAGQIYNRKYWKLPIFYGGFLGCTYALMWNQQMYKDYSQAYIDIMDDDPNTKSYMNMLPPNYDMTGLEDRFKTIFKNKKDRYRRWRDYAAFSFVGVYLLSVIDAYVDAQLSAFDISKDLSLNVKPTVIPVNGAKTSTAVGVGCGLNF